MDSSVHLIYHDYLSCSRNFHSSSSDSAAIITNAFTAVINASVLDALDAWKEARVIPLFKKEKEFVRGIACIASILV